ncbi:arylamine N-acetyltransferase family protein [Salinicoccus halitifaciens]|uniref:Arylamine N-acetyltransferase n=1 Tax=Salinicoccus halitifaciens TaxID=1073415 RepID=A0ABV2EA22_9STAP|nr:arylamine N-acetyltransferase [Salinicoccus halitifaciens]MCD2138408.1 arylamine N-acetyltransferase [Salinicoccus halitifaciens]
MINEMDRFLGHPSGGLDGFISSYMERVPFENIDVQNKVPISVELEDIFDKIITRGRGGFCYEMNTLFRYYLNAKGHDAYNVSATVKNPDGWTREGSHMSTLVRSDGLYVADVGFGDLPVKAMPIRPAEEAIVVDDVNGRYRAVEAYDGFEVQKDYGNGFETLYRGGFTPRKTEEFHDNLMYNQQHPDSIFVRKLLITMPKSYGRVSMSENNLTITKDGKKEKFEVDSGNYRKFLKEHFDLDVEIKRLEK